MTVSPEAPLAPVAGPERGRRRAMSRKDPLAGKQMRMSYLFVFGYVLFLAAFGVAPTLYALYLSVHSTSGRFVWFRNFAHVRHDFRFMPAVIHVGSFLVIWLVALLILVTVLAIIVHALSQRWLSPTVRFIYYIPGAVAGASSVVLWLFVLNPTVSPVSGVLHAFGLKTFVQTISPAHLPVIFAIIAFWSGAGGWIVVMYGALNSIPTEIMEAARVDGAGAVRTAWNIQLPMMRKWISYMAVISLAAGTQLFVEPTVLSQASQGVVPIDYSLNQLAYQYAFKQTDNNGAAAIAVMLLVVCLVLSVFFVIRGGLFERD